MIVLLWIAIRLLDKDFFFDQLGQGLALLTPVENEISVETNPSKLNTVSLQTLINFKDLTLFLSCLQTPCQLSLSSPSVKLPEEGNFATGVRRHVTRTSCIPRVLTVYHTVHTTSVDDQAATLRSLTGGHWMCGAA